MSLSAVAGKVVALESMATTSSQQDMAPPLLNTSPRYSISDKASLLDSPSSRVALDGKPKVRRGSFKSANGSLFTGITNAFGRHGFGQ